MRVGRKTRELGHLEALRFLNRFLDGLKSHFVLFYLGFLLDNLFGIVSPVLFGIMIDRMVYYRDLTLFLRLGTLFFALCCFRAVLYYWLYDIYEVCWDNILARVRFRIYQTLQRMDAEEMTNTNTGDLLDLIQNRVYECINFIVRAVIHNINNILSIAASLLLVFLIDPRIGGLMTAIAPVSVWVSWKFGKRVREENYANQLRYGEYAGWLYEMLGGLKDIRLLGAENRVQGLFRQKQQALMDSDVKAGITSLGAEHLIAGCNTAVQLALFGLLALAAAEENLTIGSVVVVLTYFSNLRSRFDRVSNTYLSTQYQLSVITRIKAAVEKPMASSWDGSETLVLERDGGAGEKKRRRSSSGSSPSHTGAGSRC